MQISAHLQRDRFWSMMENNYCGFYSAESFWCPSKFLSSFESTNDEVCNKNHSYRPMKGEQKHILYQNIKISLKQNKQQLTLLLHLAAEPFITIC